MEHDKRLIEDSLPLAAISKQSAREKSIRHGHISTLHIWWARRPLAAMRAAIFASLIPAPKDEEERLYLHDLITDIVDWDAVKKGNNARVLEARELIRKHYPDAPPKVLDPFMGGGSTGLEALRLGAEAHGVELNPVAYLIELCTLVYPQKYGQPVTVVPDDYEGPLDQSELDLPDSRSHPSKSAWISRVASLISCKIRWQKMCAAGASGCWKKRVRKSGISTKARTVKKLSATYGHGRQSAPIPLVERKCQWCDSGG